MSLLTMIQNVADETQLAEQPSTVVGNSDPFTRQSLALITKVGKELLGQHNWEELVIEDSFTTDASGSYAIGTAFATSGDFEHFVSDTMWDRSNTTQAVIVTAAEWQAILGATISSSGVSRFARTRGGNLLLDPDASGDTMFFEYLSKFWIESSGGTAKGSFTDDTDTVKYAEHLLELGLKMKLKQAKSLPWAAEMDDFEREKERLMAGEMPLKTLGGRRYHRYLNIPYGNFG